MCQRFPSGLGSRYGAVVRWQLVACGAVLCACRQLLGIQQPDGIGDGGQVGDGRVPGNEDGRGSGSGSDGNAMGAMLIQQATSVGHGTSVMATLSPPTSGDLLVALVTCGEVVASVQGGGASWTQASANGPLALWYGVVGTPATTVTATCTGNSVYALDVTEWSDAQTLDQAGDGSANTSPAMVSLHDPPAGDLVVLGVLEEGTGSAVPAPGSWTALSALSELVYLQEEWWEVLPNSSSIAPSVTTSGAWYATVAAFRP